MILLVTLLADDTRVISFVPFVSRALYRDITPEAKFESPRSKIKTTDMRMSTSLGFSVSRDTTGT